MVRPSTKNTIIKVCVCTLCIVVVVISGMYLYDINKIVYYCAVGLFALAAPIYCLIDSENHPHFARTAFVVIVFSAACVALYLVYYMTGLSERFSDFDAIKQVILDSGMGGVAVFVGLTIFQVVVLPIPSALTILLGVAIYGATYSFILSTVGTIIGSMISFMLGKVFGRRLSNWMFGSANTEKYAEILGRKGKAPLIIMLIFPAFPDDMLCMIAGITNITYAQFALIATLTRPIMIGFTAYLGSGIIPFEGWGIPVWIALACFCFVAFVAIAGIKTKLERREKKLKDIKSISEKK